ncbi:hypothetical protein [Streptomyces sp. NPDC056291]|uniref:hypothetical protein n=1 Tax=Streptomyces sp. NPDC056291 TaxID=3345772 RepID=UPI0035D64ADC
MIRNVVGKRAAEAAVTDARRAVAEFDGACQWLAAARQVPMEPLAAGDSPGDEVRAWNTGPTSYRKDADAVYRVPEAKGSHGGLDQRIIEEFCRFMRKGGVTDTSPVAARMSVATGAITWGKWTASGGV